MKAQRTPGEQWRDDPMRRPRMIVAGLFGLVPATLVGLEGANVASHVIEPLARYIRAHPPVAGAGPTWYGQVGPIWRAFVSHRAYLPWMGWPALTHHPWLLLGSGGFGAAFGGVMMIVAGRERYLNWGGPVSTGKGQYGSAHWRPPGELTQSNAWWSAHVAKTQSGMGAIHPATRFGRKREPAVQTSPPSGLLVGADAVKRPTGGWVLTRDEHTLLMSATRAGKTRRVIIPSIGIIAMAKQASMVITDPKGEVYSHTAAWLREQGYAVTRLDLIDPGPGISRRFNPMAAISEFMGAEQQWAKAAKAARQIAHFLMYATQSSPVNTEPLWIHGQIALTTAMILYVAAKAPEGARHLGSVYRTLLALSANEGAGLDVALGQLPAEHPARLAYGPAQVAKEKVRMSFLTSALASLEIFGDAEMTWLTSAQDTDWGIVGAGDRPSAVFLTIPDEDKSRYAIATMAIDQIFQALTLQARQHGGRLPRNVHFLLDEFGNMPQFPDFDSFITVSAGRGMRLALVLQNLEQLQKHYKDAERTIRGNCGTWLYLKTADLQTARELSDMTGQYTIQTESTQKPKVSLLSLSSAVGNVSEGESLAGRHLVSPDEFLRWPEDRVWHWQIGKAPANLALPDLSAWPCFAPIAEPHAFTPWPAQPGEEGVLVWAGGGDESESKSETGTKEGDLVKNGSAPPQSNPTPQPDIPATPTLTALFAGQLAAVDPDDLPAR